MNMPYLPRVSKWEREPESPFDRFWIILVAIILGGLIIFLTKPARADEIINVEKLATAIYHAEGGAKTSHPYGILAHYKTTTPKQVCINTINHALKDFQGGDFIAFLGSRYAPTQNCANDPTGLNKNWVKNVRRLYEQA